MDNKNIIELAGAKSLIYNAPATAAPSRSATSIRKLVRLSNPSQIYFVARIIVKIFLILIGKNILPNSLRANILVNFNIKSSVISLEI